MVAMSNTEARSHAAWRRELSKNSRLAAFNYLMAGVGLAALKLAEIERTVARRVSKPTRKPTIEPSERWTPQPRNHSPSAKAQLRQSTTALTGHQKEPSPWPLQAVQAKNSMQLSPTRSLTSSTPTGLTHQRRNSA